METIVSLKKPLKNCQHVLGRFTAKLERLLHRRSNGVIGIKWAFFAKSEMRDLKVSLEAMKETFHFASTTLST